MRFAILETKMIMVMIMGQYDYIVVDKDGKNVTTQPELYRDNLCVAHIRIHSLKFINLS